MSIIHDRQTNLEVSRTMRWQLRSVAVPGKLASEARRDKRASSPPRRAPCQVGAHAGGGMTHHVSCRGVRLSLARLIRPFAGTKSGISLRWRFPTGALSKRSRDFWARFATAGCSVVLRPSFSFQSPFHLNSFLPTLSFLLPFFSSFLPSPLTSPHSQI